MKIYGLADMGPMDIKVVVLDYDPHCEQQWVNNCDTFSSIPVVTQHGSWWPWRWTLKKWVLLYSSPRKHEGQNFGNDFTAASAYQQKLVKDLSAK